MELALGFGPLGPIEVRGMLESLKPKESGIASGWREVFAPVLRAWAQSIKEERSSCEIKIASILLRHRTAEPQRKNSRGSIITCSSFFLGLSVIFHLLSHFSAQPGLQGLLLACKKTD